ncbi:iron-sulfur cluster assembly scaffold protein [Candidatus Gracilibacteria bacterium]|nr:iron-sulfur cluster assembly scaffold protein [Candidatus Gracilibacteria bacterium]
MDTNALIIEYSNNPSNKYIMEDADIRYREHNRVCADVIEVFAKFRDNKIHDFSFDGYMSIVATACTAITGESLIGTDIDEVLTYDESYITSIIGDGISPRRKNASLIGLLAMKNAIHEWKKDGVKEDFSDVTL